MNKMKVAFFPYGSDNNPYQLLLKEALEYNSKGKIKVVRVPARKWFPYALPALRDADFIHHFWPHDFYTGRNKITELLKQISFLISLIWLNKKVIYSADNLVGHDYKNFNSEVFWIQKIVNKSRAIVFMSNASRDQFLRYYKIKPNCELIVLPHINYLKYYPNVISSSKARDSLGIKYDSKVLLSLGRISPYKGIIELIQSFINLKEQNAVLVIAGKCTDLDYFKLIDKYIKIAEKDGVRIIFKNQFIQDENLQYFFNAANGVVLNYKDFPMNPGSILLAMGFGCSIIAPSIGAIPETVPIESFFGYDPDIPGSFESALRSFISTEQILEMGELNRKIIDQKHSPEMVGGKLTSLYEKLIINL